MTTFVAYSQLPLAGALTGSEIFSMTQGTTSVGTTYSTLNAYYSSLTTTLTNKTISGASNTLTNIPNSALSNNSITVAGKTIALGGSQALAASDLSNGVTGSGSIVLATAPTLGVTTVTHLVGNSATPTAAAGTGAGTSPTLTVAGTDSGFKLTVVTGTSPTANGVVATITFSSVFAAAPVPSVAEGNAITASITSAACPFITTTTSTLVLTANATALTASTTYVWYFQLVG